MTSHASELVIRVAGDDDLNALAELRALWTVGAEPEPNFTERMAAWVAAEGERRTTWLATGRGRPLGMVSLFEYRRMPKPGQADSRWGYVGNLFVHADVRNRGIASALLTEVIAVAEQRSYARLVVSPTTDALSIFRRAGFVVPAEATGGASLLVRLASGPKLGRAS